MEDRTKEDFRLFLGVLVFFLVVFLGAALPGHCQGSTPYPVKVKPTPEKEPHHMTHHTDEDEWENTIGVTFITVTSMDKELIYYYVTRKFEQKLSSIGHDDKTIYQDETKKFIPEGCFMMMYCKTHLMAYLLVRIKCTKKE